MQRVFGLLALVFWMIGATDAVAADWSTVRLPALGKAEVVGSPTAGCVAGAVNLPLDGVGYQAVRVGRNRHWGHPTLIHYLEKLGESVIAAGLEPIYIGDLSQPRGGPTSYGHASHQSGLEADIWFSLAPKPNRPPQERDTIDTRSLVAKGGFEVSRKVWQDGHRQLLELAARSDDVERIFVNAAIKRELCHTVTGDRSWLRKIRAWYHHDDHFHVRLNCPPQNKLCVTGRRLPDGDGCGEALARWFRPEMRGPANAAIKAGVVIHHPKPHLHAACRAILTNPEIKRN